MALDRRPGCCPRRASGEPAVGRQSGKIKRVRHRGLLSTPDSPARWGKGYQRDPGQGAGHHAAHAHPRRRDVIFAPLVIRIPGHAVRPRAGDILLLQAATPGQHQRPAREATAWHAAARAGRPAARRRQGAGKHDDHDRAGHQSRTAPLIGRTIGGQQVQPCATAARSADRHPAPRRAPARSACTEIRLRLGDTLLVVVRRERSSASCRAATSSSCSRAWTGRLVRRDKAPLAMSHHGPRRRPGRPGRACPSCRVGHQRAWCSWCSPTACPCAWRTVRSTWASSCSSRAMLALGERPPADRRWSVHAEH